MTHSPSPVSLALTVEQESAGEETKVDAPQITLEAPMLTWESLHGVIAAALRHVDLAAPLYVAADVLTDELLPSLNGVNRPIA
jgi:hypothetical protein